MLTTMYVQINDRQEKQKARPEKDGSSELIAWWTCGFSPFWIDANNKTNAWSMPQIRSGSTDRITKRDELYTLEFSFSMIRMK